MTGQELFEKSKAEDLATNPESPYPWGEWDNLSKDERAGWDRKAAEEAPKKAAPKADDGKKEK